MPNVGGGIIIMDFDDVLVDLSTIVYSKIRENWRIFSRWLVDLGPLTPKQIQDRCAFRFNEWLLKKEFINLTPREYVKEQLMYMTEMKQHVFTSNIYDQAKPTKFAERTLLNPLYIDSTHVKKIYILSRNATKEQEISKKKFIEKYFKHEKIEYIPVEENESKGSVLKKLNVNWNLFVDDELPNIRSIAESEKYLEKKEFLIPQLGYNKMDRSLDLLIKGKGAAYTYYTP